MITASTLSEFHLIQCDLKRLSSSAASNESAFTLAVLQRMLEDTARSMRLPATFANDRVQSSGYQNVSTEDCLVLYHPDHPRDFHHFCIRLNAQGNDAFISVSTFGGSNPAAKIHADFFGVIGRASMGLLGSLVSPAVKAPARRDASANELLSSVGRASMDLYENQKPSDEAERQAENTSRDAVFASLNRASAGVFVPPSAIEKKESHAEETQRHAPLALIGRASMGVIGRLLSATRRDHQKVEERRYDQCVRLALDSTFAGALTD